MGAMTAEEKRARRIRPLTDTEAQFAEAHMGIIFWYLSRRQLPFDEWFDVVVIRYLEAVKRWHEDEALRARYSFTTIAVGAIRSSVVLNFGESQRIPYLRFDCEEAGDLEQLSTILAVLVEKTGLKIPTSYIYKKFGIPRPEDGEDVASPNAPAMPAWAGSPVAHKADIPINRQARVDALASAAISASASGFEAVFSPVLELVAGAASMDELKEAFTDPVQMATLLRQMDASQAEVLLQKTMLYANLDGRALEDG